MIKSVIFNILRCICHRYQRRYRLQFLIDLLDGLLLVRNKLHNGIHMLLGLHISPLKFSIYGNCQILIGNCSNRI